MIDIVKYGMWSLLILAALQDVMQLRISNLFVLAILALFPFWLVAVGFNLDVWQNLVVFALAFVLGSLAFHFGLIGGGDAKLFMAGALWFNLADAPHYLMSIVLFGALMTFVLIILRRVLPLLGFKPSPQDKADEARGAGWAMLEPKGPIPYGVAIAAGAILCAVLYGFDPQPVLHLPAVDFTPRAVV
ncbi:A24 family peptidase [Aquisediminimonas sediminicola]|uniref:A24 family peptidase n=1 Tax=Alteraquisediminimonas sediminicola TaxID=2676787 RepID=UPI001C8F0D02|nr:prepilin peptidase [Aquisediminimonas sediminicola]